MKINDAYLYIVFFPNQKILEKTKITTTYAFSIGIQPRRGKNKRPRRSKNGRKKKQQT